MSEELDARALVADQRELGRRHLGHRSGLLAAGLAGALLLVVADLVARTVAAPSEIPLGVLTALVGSPFFFEKPKVRAIVVDHSWAVPGIQAGGVPVSKYWPYAPERVILVPDFTNKINAAARYASPFSLPIFNKYLLAAADEMEKGLESYRRAALGAPASKRRTAFREVLLAEQLQRMMRSDQAILEFEDLRLKLAKAATPAERSSTVDRMAVILKEEIARTEASRETQLRDSRLGYEWEQDYFYTPEVLAEKVLQLRGVLDREIPAYRKRNGLK